MQKMRLPDQANAYQSLFKKLNAPVEAKKEQEVAAYWADIAQKKDSIAQRAIQTKDSISYRATHQNITFVLKGLWQEDLTTQLSPVRWTETNTEPDSSAERSRSTKKPYLAQFEVRHPQYAVYELPVLVTGKKQQITITADHLSQEQVTIKKSKTPVFIKPSKQ